MGTKVVCIRKGESGHSDCRCIEELGLKGGERISREEAWRRVTDDQFALYIYLQGSVSYLEPAEREGTRYVRSEKTDSPDDNLLDLDICDVA